MGPDPSAYCPAFMGRPTGEIPVYGPGRRNSRRVQQYDDPQYPETGGMPTTGLDASGRPYPAPSPAASPSFGPQQDQAYPPPGAQQGTPPYGGAAFPAPDGWGHTDPLGRPYSRAGRYEANEMDMDYADDHENNDAEGYTEMHEEEDLTSALEAIVGALQLLQMCCSQEG